MQRWYRTWSASLGATIAVELPTNSQFETCAAAQRRSKYCRTSRSQSSSDVLQVIRDRLIGDMVPECLCNIVVMRSNP